MHIEWRYINTLPLLSLHDWSALKLVAQKISKTVNVQLSDLAIFKGFIGTSGRPLSDQSQ